MAGRQLWFATQQNTIFFEFEEANISQSIFNENVNEAKSKQ